MPTVVILPRAEAQIIDVLGYTLEEFGEAKYFEYRDLIGLALKTLEVTPMRASTGRRFDHTFANLATAIATIDW